MGDTIPLSPRVSIFLPPFCFFQRQEGLIINPVTSTTVLPSGRRGFIECANFGEPVLTFSDSHHIRSLMIHSRNGYSCQTDPWNYDYTFLMDKNFLITLKFFNNVDQKEQYFQVVR
jgi:hypothetical protein